MPLPDLEDHLGNPLPSNLLYQRKKEIDIAVKKQSEDKVKSMQLAAAIFDQLLSVTSMNLVKECQMEKLDDEGNILYDETDSAVYEDWDTDVVNRDPVSIMRRIDKTHMTANTGSDLNDRCHLIVEFYAIKQKHDESLGQFMDRFHHHLRIMEANECHILEEQELVGLFIMKLRDDTYGEFKASCDNEYRRQRGIYPKTILEAFKNAQYFCPTHDKPARILSQAERLMARDNLDPASAFQAGVDLSDRVDQSQPKGFREAGRYQGPGNGRWAPSYKKEPALRPCDYCLKDGVTAHHWHKECPKVTQILRNARYPSVVAKKAQDEQRLALKQSGKRKVSYLLEEEDAPEQHELESHESLAQDSETNDLSDKDQGEF
jgi:hypothetical protein